MMEAKIKPNSTWIVKTVMQQRDSIPYVQQLWDQMLGKNKFRMKVMYNKLREDAQVIAWRHLMYGNVARPRAIMTM